MRKTPEEDGRLVSQTESQTLEDITASGDSIIIASAISELASAIRYHAESIRVFTATQSIETDEINDILPQEL